MQSFRARLSSKRATAKVGRADMKSEDSLASHFGKAGAQRWAIKSHAL